MKICIFGASSEIDPKYYQASEKLAEKLGEAGHSLVFGGFNDEIMKRAGKGFSKHGAEIIGVVPEFFCNDREIYDGCTEVIHTKTLAERKQKMIEMSDVFLCLPGGLGTFDEFFEVMALKNAGQLDKPILMYNVEGFYDSLVVNLMELRRNGFIPSELKKLFRAFISGDDIVEYINKL